MPSTKKNKKNSNKKKQQQNNFEDNFEDNNFTMQDLFRKEIEIRSNYSIFLENVLNNSKNEGYDVEQKIYELIDLMNNNYSNDVAAFIYGGRCWNYLLEEYKNSMDTIEKISCIKGNFDVVIITNYDTRTNEKNYIKQIDES